MVVAGLGIVPDTELAEAEGLPVDNGIVVDEYGCAGDRDDVFAAGDVANFPITALGGMFRVEHEDHANTHGKVVGANMAGAEIPYDHLPFFYSDMFDLGYEAVGEVDSRLATVEHWVEPNRKGVVAYTDDAGRPRGFLLWNTWGKVDAVRELIMRRRPRRRGDACLRLVLCPGRASRARRASSCASASSGRSRISSSSRCCRCACRRPSSSPRRAPPDLRPRSSSRADTSSSPRCSSS